jgi:hypothetical protein
MIIRQMTEMFRSFDIRILNIVSGFDIRISDLGILRILLFDQAMIYFDVTVSYGQRAGNCKITAKVIGFSKSG